MDRSQLERLVAEADRDGIGQLVVGAVVADDEDRVLLLKRRADDFMGGLWELPSGKADPAEALDDALAREVKEETGLDLAAITAYLGCFDYTGGSGRPTRQCNFGIEVAATAPIVLTEHDQHQWVSRSEPLPVSEAVKHVLASTRS